MATPKKLVHWAIDQSSLDLGSPFSNTSSEPATSASTLQYVNSQLVGHGFAPSPGISLDGISNADCERAVKCFLGLLSQRVEDMSRTEELSTKLRTLSYEHERLVSMHCVATETAANAEREVNLHKSRLITMERTLRSAENAHKKTTADLQRTRASVVALRAVHQNELKKKEKDIERMVEKWTKLSDAQARLGIIGSGIRIANVNVIEGSELLGKGQNFIETALEEAEHERGRLNDENMRLRRLVLTAVNEAQSLLHSAQSSTSENDEEPAPLTLQALFPLSPQNVAWDKMTTIVSALREAFSSLSENFSIQKSIVPTKSSPPDGEVEKLQAIISSLRSELEQAHHQSAAHAAHTQALFDQIAKDHHNTRDDIGEMSMDLMTAPARDEEKERLQATKKQLNEEREKFTEAAVKLGRERAALEAERIKLLDEKRSLQVELMLAELPPTPKLGGSPARRKEKTRSNGKSPHKSPGKGVNGKKTRISRRSSLLSKIIPPFETEVVPPLPAAGKSAAPLLPTSFVLPPPSPLSSLPSRLTSLTAPQVPEPPMPEASTSFPKSAVPVSSNDGVPDLPTLPALLPPFPVAKPLAPRMIHAYSPARPSPLSRILMLAHSPGSPDGIGKPLAGVMEQDEIDFSTPSAQIPALFAGMMDNNRDNPLQEKKANLNPGVSVLATTAKGRVLHPPPVQKQPATLEKGKEKNEVVGQTRPRATATGEKENDAKRAKVSSAAGTVGIGRRGVVGGTTETKTVKLAEKAAGSAKSKARVMVKLPSGKAGGARRVPVGSSQAGVSAARGRRG